MISAPVKIACGLGTAGAVGTGCYFAVTNLVVSKKKTISDRLSREKFTLLSFENGNETEWKAILKEYEKVTNTDKFLEVKIDTSSSDKDQKNIGALKLACKALIDKEDSSEDFYKKARRWCVIPQSIKERMTALQATILDYSSEKASNKSWADWEEKIKTYKGTELSSSSTWSTVSSRGDDEKINVIKKDCKDFLEGDSRSYDEDFEAKYKKAVDWCG